MDLGISGKTALVTGSTAGIGFATAMGLAFEGAHVVVTGRTQARVDAALAALSKAQPKASAEGVAGDLSTADGCANLIQRIPEVDILVNNLGIYSRTDFEDISDDAWYKMFDTNVMSGVRLTRHYLAGMKAKDWGRVVFVSSESAQHIPKEMVHYGATKSIQVAIARGIAESLASTAITVNSVLVGPTRSEGVGGLIEQRAKERGISFEEMQTIYFQETRPTSLLKRFLKPEEVANMILYACSAAASATTGTPLRVDGGVVRAAF
ncbi:MAG: SDR family NAD(P)-dependent oxidoreductase [Rhodospirillales bacterium]